MKPLLPLVKFASHAIFLVIMGMMWWVGVKILLVPLLAIGPRYVDNSMVRTLTTGSQFLCELGLGWLLAVVIYSTGYTGGLLIQVINDWAYGEDQQGGGGGCPPASPPTGGKPGKAAPSGVPSADMPPDNAAGAYDTNFTPPYLGRIVWERYCGERTRYVPRYLFAATVLLGTFLLKVPNNFVEWQGSLWR